MDEFTYNLSYLAIRDVLRREAELYRRETRRRPVKASERREAGRDLTRRDWTLPR